VLVWYTFLMKPMTITIDQAKNEKLFYFVANVVIYRPSDGRCLILKRSDRETARPGKWGVVGGKLEWKDLDPAHPTRVNGNVLDYEHAVEDLLAREAKEEAGVEIERKLHYINSVGYIRPDGVPVVMVKFAARYLAGDIRIEEKAFSDFRWVNADEVQQYDCILGVPGEVAMAIKLFSR